MICGDRHVAVTADPPKAYRNFTAEKQGLQDERIAAFKEYIADVQNGRFPTAENTVGLADAQFAAIVKAIEDPVT